MPKVISAAQAAALVKSGDTLVIGGSGGGHAVPDRLMQALGERFRETRQPAGITALHPVGLGDGADKGAGHLAQDGLLARVVSGTYVNSPGISDLVQAGKIEGWTLPQGALSQLMREMAAGRPGLLSKTGLHTFVDPRLGGGRQSEPRTGELVELIEFRGEELLFYKPFHVNVCFLRGTTADEDGNVTMEQEAVFGEMLSEAQATRRCGGIVIVQVRRMAQRGTLPAKQVKIPGILVDYIVVEPDQRQTYLTPYSPAYAGELRIPMSDMPRLPLDARKVIARRAALELMTGAICNLGSGISTGIAGIAAEEGALDAICLTNEQGLVGGAPASGGDAGAATNYAALVDQPYQFDFYDGGGLDLAFLSFAEVDFQGNVNVSRFGKRIIGPGGFVNISQNARSVIYSGTFTAGASRLRIGDGRLQIEQDGPHRKFVEQVQQITYSGPYGARCGQRVLYITERAVFELNPAGLTLIEIAPGIDLERDVLAHMDFKPIISASLQLMDAALFCEASIGLAARLAERGPITPRSARIAAGEGVPA
ncbi:MAG: CoA-transferase [Castellaniella sp.]|uniref:Acetate CoA-transferase YdiF n=1 Tax=Castellaniella hirudinis TaxID=1144617 RepID=A0ABV8RZ59_9BURK